jgi:hypothetical protein
MSELRDKIIATFNAIERSKLKRVLSKLVMKVGQLYASLSPELKTIFSNTKVALDIGQTDESLNYMITLLENLVTSSILSQETITSFVVEEANKSPVWYRRLRSIVLFTIILSGYLSSLIGAFTALL